MSTRSLMARLTRFGRVVEKALDAELERAIAAIVRCPECRKPPSQLLEAALAEVRSGPPTGATCPRCGTAQAEGTS
jgi:hypothetical protein